MNKIRAFSLLVCLAGAGSLSAQVVQGVSLTPEERVQSREKRQEQASKMQAAGVREMVIQTQDYRKGKAHGDLQTATVQGFDAQGYTHSMAYFRKGKLFQHKEYTYDPQGNLLTEHTVNRKQNTLSRRTCTWEGDRMVSDQTLRGKRLHQGTHTAWAYDTGGRLLTADQTRVQNGKTVQRWECTYDAAGGKQRITRYDGKGRQQNVTDYACDPAGKTLSAQKARQQQVCERMEPSASGELCRVVETFTGTDEVFRTLARYNSRNQMVEYETYDPQGTLITHLRSTFNAEGRLQELEQTGPHGHYIRTEYAWNAQGLVQQEVRYARNGDMIKDIRYRYTFF